MRYFQCLLFVLKRSYICYYIICMTVPLKQNFPLKFSLEKLCCAEFKTFLKDNSVEIRKIF